MTGFSQARRGVEKGHGSMGVGAGVDDEPGVGGAPFLDGVDYLAFRVGLAEVHVEPQLGAALCAHGLDVGQGFLAVDVGLARTQ